MPSKKKFSARFPPARIKKIMQTDEDIGKVAAPVPVLISRALELFLEQILTKTSHVVNSRQAKTLSRSHIKHAVMNEAQFDFLKDLVSDIDDIPDIDAKTPDNPAPRSRQNSTSNKRRRGRPRKCENQSPSDSDEALETPERKSPSNNNDSKSEEPSPPAQHGRKDIMLPVIVSVDDEEGVGKDLGVAGLPVPIATPMASPNTLLSSGVMAEAMQAVARVDGGDDDDYDS